MQPNGSKCHLHSIGPPLGSIEWGGPCGSRRLVGLGVSWSVQTALFVLFATSAGAGIVSSNFWSIIQKGFAKRVEKWVIGGAFCLPAVKIVVGKTVPLRKFFNSTVDGLGCSAPMVPSGLTGFDGAGQVPLKMFKRDRHRINIAAFKCLAHLRFEMRERKFCDRKGPTVPKEIGLVEVSFEKAFKPSSDLDCTIGMCPGDGDKRVNHL